VVTSTGAIAIALATNLKLKVQLILFLAGGLSVGQLGSAFDLFEDHRRRIHLRLAHLKKERHSREIIQKYKRANYSPKSK
jgi:hypothetical protein